jgi:2-keto-4-pentenoate hydratase/2-oxohepta-3-ene-1,7-dioic acid hydratase in catechol pathway
MKTIICLNGEKKNTVTPSKIVCIGRNYVAHAKELGNTVPTSQIIFLKPNSAISTVLTSSSQSFKVHTASNSSDNSRVSAANTLVNGSESFFDSSDTSASL